MKRSLRWLKEGGVEVDGWRRESGAEKRENGSHGIGTKDRRRGRRRGSGGGDRWREGRKMGKTDIVG